MAISLIGTVFVASFLFSISSSADPLDLTPPDNFSPLPPSSVPITAAPSRLLLGTRKKKARFTADPEITMRVMLADAILSLNDTGFTFLSITMKTILYPELESLSNMTIFAIDDGSILFRLYRDIGKKQSPGDDSSVLAALHGFLRTVTRFHIVPNRFLPIGDLESLPERTVLPTLESGGASLLVTNAGGGRTGPPFMINYVAINDPEIVRNRRIVVHSVRVPFPRIDTASDHVAENRNDSLMIELKDEFHKDDDYFDDL